MPELYWLPDATDFAGAVARAATEGSWPAFVALAKHRLNFIETNKLDRACANVFNSGPSAGAMHTKIAVLSSCTVTHLFPGIRVAAMRRGLRGEVYACDYGQYRQELADRGSPLYAFGPQVAVFALDSEHLLAGAQFAFEAGEAASFCASVVSGARDHWRLAKDAFGCQVIQQLGLPTHPLLLGSNEHRYAGSRAALIQRMNASFAEVADAEGVDLLDLSAPIVRDGLSAWHDPVLWHRAKQEISPAASPGYGDQLVRLIAARRGLSAKCLVLDLDNTLWGGVVGDDGVEGIRIGQGDAEGEAYVAFQNYVRGLAERGVILAVCSKNDEANALAPFERHPDMVLKRSDISCFVANWDDKATNIHRIAKTLNIGVDSLVFADDNPFEREIVRRELPRVAVPELPDDAALYARCLADAGYFESLQITQEDRDRTGQYRANSERTALQASHTNMDEFLASLSMELRVRKFDRIGLKRITQLINKTNQFNLTTKRYSEQQAAEVLEDGKALGLQFRLVDRFGDNGVIAVAIARVASDAGAATIDTWLMSCRVLGRKVEEATLDVLADALQERGVSRLIGQFKPSEKNGMVRDHYEKLGFEPAGASEDGSTLWSLSLQGYERRRQFISVVQEADA